MSAMRIKKESSFATEISRIFCVCAFLISTGPGLAQTNDEINAGLQFERSPPGARSLALGNAFTGLADDATAAVSNPAGLLWLSQSEVSVEIRRREHVQPFPYSGSAEGQPTGNGIDTTDELEIREFTTENSGVGYAAYVHAPKGRWRWALYRHELARFSSEIESLGPFFRTGGARSRLSAIQAALDLEIVCFGFSAAYEINERLWVGAGIANHDFQMDAVTRRYLTIDAFSPTSFPVYELEPLTPSNERDRHTQQGDDSALAGIAGLLWRPRGDRFSLGLVYRQGPKFDLDYRFQWGQRSITLAAGDRTGDGVPDSPVNLDFIDPGVIDALSGRTDFEVPSVVSVGLAWRPTSHLTILLQGDHVGYSSLEPRANLILEGIDSIRPCGSYDAAGQVQNPPKPCNIDNNRLARFSVPDTIEIHLGVEWISQWRLPVAWRFGAWHEPDHSMTFDPRDFAPEDRIALAFPKGDDEVHVTFGFGVALPSWQIDLGADLSDRGDVISLSTVYRF